jgi:hypothetical protein
MEEVEEDAFLLWEHNGFVECTRPFVGRGMHTPLIEREKVEHAKLETSFNGGLGQRSLWLLQPVS